MKKIFIISFILILSVLTVSLALAQTAPESSYNPLDRLTGDTGAAEVAGLSTYTDSPQALIFRIIIWLIGFVGIFFLVSIIFAGWQWMSSGGNEENISKAKARLKNSVIGVIIILISYAGVSYLERLVYYSTCTDGYYCDYGKHPTGECNNDNDCLKNFGSDKWKCSEKGSCNFVTDSCNNDNDCLSGQSCYNGWCFAK